VGRLVLRREDQGDTVFSALVRLDFFWKMESASMSMTKKKLSNIILAIVVIGLILMLVYL
jgi:hypothetical protein